MVNQLKLKAQNSRAKQFQALLEEKVVRLTGDQLQVLDREALESMTRGA